MEITKREIVVSIAIIAIMLVIGFCVSGKINDYQNDRNAEYQKAVHIENPELFQHGMDTNVGNAFVYGDLEAVDTVTFEEIGGKYLYVEKVEEHYNRHTRIVTKTRTRSDGTTETYTEEEVYYSWDYYNSWEKHSEKIRFLDIEFDYEKIQRQVSHYIDMRQEFLSDVRFIYYGVASKHTGTIYTRLSDGTILDNSRFFDGMTADEALEKCVSNGEGVAFWIVWVCLIIACVCGFCYLDNRWLED